MKHLDVIQKTLREEAEAMMLLGEKLGPTAEQVVELLLDCQGRLVVSGMGKMGLIARKAAATFCSTGTPAIFLHPGEAVHGDLGVVTSQDVWLALSNSGETQEVNDLLPFMHRFKIPVVAITGNPQSSLATRSQYYLNIGVADEIDTLTGAPTTSTTLALALCDALAIAMMKHRGFTAEQFAIFHPAGHLGRKLLLTVDQIMHTADRIPVNLTDEKVTDAIFTMSQKGLGATVVLNETQMVEGIFTDGDLRRTFEKHDNPNNQVLSSVMTKRPVCIKADALAAEALKLMEDREISVLPVINVEEKLVGVVHLHDLIRAGLA